MLSFGSQSVTVRRGTPADARVLARIFRESWKLAYTGIIPEPHLEGMIRRRPPIWWKSALAKQETMLVLQVGETVAGYASYGACRSKGRYRGEIFEIYLEPAYQGLGFGEHLFEACRSRLDAAGHAGTLVWVLAENHGAVDFYWRRGGQPIAKCTDKIGGRKVEKLAFAWD
jgi:ribosomal protein S18 acetylase RimI-like enzyme